MSDTTKMKEFVAEPMGQKPVTALPGIGTVYGERLTKKGFGKAFMVYGEFLLLDKDKAKFTAWLTKMTDADADDRDRCFEGLKEWDQQHFDPVDKEKFVWEPMGQKLVTTIPGIGKVYGERLTKKGFAKAFMVYGEFLIRDKNKEKFTAWLKEIADMDADDRDACFDAMYQWDQQHFE